MAEDLEALRREFLQELDQNVEKVNLINEQTRIKTKECQGQV